MKSIVDIMKLIRTQVYTAKVHNKSVIQDCRLSIADGYDKFLAEITDMSKFPAVVIVAGHGSYSEGLLNREPVFGVIVVSKLAGSQEQRTIDALDNFETVAALFPGSLGSGTVIDGVTFLPGDYYQAALPDNRAAFVLELRAIQAAD